MWVDAWTSGNVQSNLSAPVLAYFDTVVVGWFSTCCDHKVEKAIIGQVVISSILTGITVLCFFSTVHALLKSPFPKCRHLLSAVWKPYGLSGRGGARGNREVHLLCGGNVQALPDHRALPPVRLALPTLLETVHVGLGLSLQNLWGTFTATSQSANFYSTLCRKKAAWSVRFKFPKMHFRWFAKQFLLYQKELR